MSEESPTLAASVEPGTAPIPTTPATTAARQYRLNLSPPAFLQIAAHSPDGNSLEVNIDVYEARRILEQAERNTDSEAKRWAVVLDWLATKTAIAREKWSESQAIEFNDTVSEIVATLNDERKKKAAQIASSPAVIPASLPGCC